MNSTINKKGNVEDMLKEEALWEDPMCYPAYDTTSLLGRNGSICKESNKNTAGSNACRVAA